MEAPRMTKTREKPATKLRVCRKIYRRLGGLAVRTELPAMLAIYTGTSGRTHASAHHLVIHYVVYLLDFNT